MSNERLQDALHRLLEMFRTGDLPAAVARTMLTRHPDDKRPSDKWSLGNRLLMLLAGTDDARGFNQWQQVGRRVKKGAKAFYILAPITRKRLVRRTETDPGTGEERVVEEERVVVIGFRGVPVFRYEDTEGEPLPEVNYDPPQLPPLFDVARRLGVEVHYRPGTGAYYGSFAPGQIFLHTHDAKTFFHELAHAAHNTIRPLRPGQHADQEVVAEVAACTLCLIYGYEGFAWHGWQYVRSYTSQDPAEALKAVMRLLSEVEQVLMVILSNADVSVDTEPVSAA